MQTIPMLSADLIEKLHEAFPPMPVTAMRTLSPEDLQYHFGQQSLLEFLDMRLEQTKQDDLFGVRT